MSTPSRSRNAALNFATSIAFATVTLLGAIISSRLIVRWVGPGRFGAYRTLTEWFGYLTLLELGLGGAIGPLLSHALSSGDRPAVRATLAASIRAYAVVALAAVAVGLALVVALPGIIPVPQSARGYQALLSAVSRLVGGPLTIPATMHPDLRLAGLLMLAGFVLLPLVPLRSLIEADQRGYEVNLLVIGQFLIITAGSLLLCGLMPPWGISGQAASATIGALLLNAGLVLATRPYLDGGPLAVALTRPDAAVWRRIWALSWPTLILQFSGRVNLQTDSIVLSRVVGVDAVTLLYFTTRLPQVAQQQLVNIGTASWAGLADLYHRDEHRTFRRRLLELLQLIAVLGMASVGPIVAYSHHFLALWVGQDLDGGGIVAAAAGANAVLIPLISQAGWCLAGTGRIHMLAVPSLIGSALNLIASIALAWYLGVAGPLVGTTVTVLVFNLWFYARLLHRVFGVSYKALGRCVGLPLVCGLPYVGALWWFANRQAPLGWVGLGAQMAVAAFGYLAFASAFVLNPADRALWRGRLGAILGQIRNSCLARNSV